MPHLFSLQTGRARSLCTAQLCTAHLAAGRPQSSVPPDTWRQKRPATSLWDWALVFPPVSAGFSGAALLSRAPRVHQGDLAEEVPWIVPEESILTRKSTL